MKALSLLQMEDLCSFSIDLCAIAGFDVPANHRFACAGTHVITCVNGFSIGKGSQTLTLVRGKWPISARGNIGDFFVFRKSFEKNIVFGKRLRSREEFLLTVGLILAVGIDHAQL